MLLTGGLGALYGGAALRFFGADLPFWPATHRPLGEIFGPFSGAPLLGSDVGLTRASDFFAAAHRLIAFLLAGSIVARFGVGAPSRFSPSAAVPSAPVAVDGLPGPTDQNPAPPVSKWALGLASRLRLLGWIQFWPQLVIVLASAVLLQFSTSGRAFSPGASGYGDAIYWSLYGFLLLCAADLLAFGYTRAARRVATRPDYLSGPKIMAFWFLSAGLLIGLLGTAISFVGASLSISLLIAKTVSQPPGIAITDPNKIVRALDVFVLLVNFSLLLGHFIGAGVAAWLTATASRAHLRYATLGDQSR